MAIAIRGVATGIVDTNPFGNRVTGAFNAQTGDACAVLVTWEGAAGGDSITITDTAGNTGWTSGTRRIGSNNKGSQWFYKANITGHATNVVQAAISPNRSFTDITAVYVSGAKETNATIFADEEWVYAAASTNATTPAFDVPRAGIALVGLVNYNNANPRWTAGTDYTLESELSSAYHAVERRIFSSAALGTTASASVSASDDIALNVLVLLEYFTDIPSSGLKTKHSRQRSRPRKRWLDAKGWFSSKANIEGWFWREWAPAGTPSGAISGTASLTFTNTATAVGAGALAGVATQTFAEGATALTGAGALAGAAAQTFTNTATGQLLGALAGAAGQSFTNSGAVVGAGALASTAAQAFTNTGTVTGAGALAAIAAQSFTNTATMGGAGALAGVSPLAFSGSGTLDLPSGALAGSVLLTFLNSGTLTGTGAETRKYPGPAGKKTRGRTKRWWHIGDKIYLGTRKDAAEMWRAFLSEQEGIPAPRPRLQSRPAPKLEVLNVDVPVPEVVYTAFDWESFYRSSMAQQDVEAAEMLIAAMRKRLEDEEDDIEALLLLA